MAGPTKAKKHEERVSERRRNLLLAKIIGVVSHYTIIPGFVGLEAKKRRKLVQSHDYILDVTRRGAYASTHEPIEDGIQPSGDEVTVGIGAMCSNGTVAVLASDLRATFPRSHVGDHDFTGKQWDFDVPFPLVACVAGKLGLCQPVVDELNNRLHKLVEKEPRIYCEHIDNAIRDARFHMFRRYADWAIRMAYGITLREWQRGKVPGGKMDKFIHDSVRALLDGLSFDVGLIVLGFLVDGNPIFYRAIGKYHNEASATPAVYVIGSGGALAMNRLNKRQQCLDFGLPRTLLHISEAMDDAQQVPDKSVGKPQAFMVVDRNGAMHRIDADAPLFREWKKDYKDRTSTASLDASEIAHKQIAALFREHEVKRSISRKSEREK